VILAAWIQFYFPHALPIDESWPSDGFVFELNPWTARVAAPPGDLFPEQIDKTLRGMTFTLEPLHRPGGTLRITVAHQVIDRLEVQVHRSNMSFEAGELPSDALLDDGVDVAVQAADILLSHLRAVGDAPFLSGVRREYRIEDGRFYITMPHTISWFGGDDPANLAPLGVYEGLNSQASPGALRAPEHSSIPFAPLAASLDEFGPEPALDRSLLVTARERITQLQLREGVVAMATACEVASDRFIASTQAHANPEAQDALSAAGMSFAERRFHAIPSAVAGRSLRLEAESIFDDVQRLYRARNNAAHAGVLCYSENGQSVQVDQEVASGFLASTRRAIAWLDELQ
jgi:hypothetical protein